MLFIDFFIKRKEIEQCKLIMKKYLPFSLIIFSEDALQLS